MKIKKGIYGYQQVIMVSFVLMKITNPNIIQAKKT